MTESSRDYFHLAPGYQPLARRAGLDARAIFEHAGIHVWRTLPDRENAYIDLEGDQGKSRWHIKRFPSHATFPLPAQDQVEAHKLIVAEQIPTASLVGWGNLADRRSFVIFENLDGYTPADKLIEEGLSFDLLLASTAKLAALLHTRGLHHRDLYLCHFMVRRDGAPDGNVDLRLIDTARVRRLPSLFGRSRWVAKDLAQFLYSTTKLPVSDAQRDAWLDHYARERGMPSSANFRGPVARKIKQIGRHDAKLMRLRPYRDVSIPQ